MQMSIILINLLIGPPLFRIALVRVGETNKAGPLLPTTTAVAGERTRRESTGGGVEEKELEEVESEHTS